MASKKVNIGSMSDEVASELNFYANSVEAKMKKIIGQVAKETCDKLHHNEGWYADRSGAYTKGWTYKPTGKKAEGVTLRNSVTVYNTEYRLTHLLENGHRIVRGGTVIGEAKAHKHITYAADYAGKRMEQLTEDIGNV